MIIRVSCSCLFPPLGEVSLAAQSWCGQSDPRNSPPHFVAVLKQRQSGEIILDHIYQLTEHHNEKFYPHGI